MTADGAELSHAMIAQSRRSIGIREGVEAPSLRESGSC